MSKSLQDLATTIWSKGTHKCSRRRAKLVKNSASQKCDDCVRCAEDSVSSVDRRRRIGFSAPGAKQVESDVEAARQADENPDNKVLPVAMVQRHKRMKDQHELQSILPVWPAKDGPGLSNRGLYCHGQAGWSSRFEWVTRAPGKLVKG